MMAALFSARDGADTLLLEQNEKLGKKLYITGKGRCNLTNTADLDQFLREVPRNGRFMLSSLSHMDHETVTKLFGDLGMPTKVERGGRVFPVSDKASDVTKALKRGMDEAGVKVLTGVRIVRIERESCEEKSGFILEAEDGTRYACRALIIATGGASYPSTGSTGDGYRFAEAFGHRVFPPQPSLVGMNMDSDWHERLQGLTLKNVRITARQGKKVLYNEMGELLFTHFGISGPLIIELSAHLLDHYDEARVVLNIKPGMTSEEVDKRLLREFSENPRRQLNNVLGSMLPARLAGLFPSMCGLAPDMLCSECTREDRKKLRLMMTDMVLPITSPRSLDEAIITRGGVDVKGVAPGTMMSKQVPGLFFAGEVLDVDAHTGGFNLQIAWSTGSLAGQCASIYLRHNPEVK